MDGARVEGLAEWRWGWADGVPFPAHTCCLWSSCRPLLCSGAAKTRRVVLPPLLSRSLRSMCEWVTPRKELDKTAMRKYSLGKEVCYVYISWSSMPVTRLLLWLAGATSPREAEAQPKHLESGFKGFSLKVLPTTLSTHS